MNKEPQTKNKEPFASDLPVTVYSPESGLHSPWALIAGLFKDLMSESCRDLSWRLMVRNISAKFRQSLLGLAWMFLPPIINAGVWIFLQAQKVLDVGETEVPYPLYVLCGNLIWQAFALSLVAPTISVTKEKAMLTKINFPREALLVAGFGELLVAALVPMIVLAPAIIYFKIALTPLQLLGGIGAVIATLMTGYTLGLLLTPIGLFYQDIAYGVPVLARFWFFATPIVYPAPTEGLIATIVRINPATYLVTTARDLLTGQPPAYLTGFYWTTGLMVVFLFIGLVMYRLAMPHVVERMSA